MSGRIGAARATASATVAAVVTILAIGSLIITAAAAIAVARQLASPKTISRHHAANARFDCLQRQLDHSVPAGATVDVTARSTLWQQRLIEFATPRLAVTPDAGKAQYLLDVAGHRPGACAGFRLVVTPNR